MWCSRAIQPDLRSGSCYGRKGNRGAIEFHYFLKRRNHRLTEFLALVVSVDFRDNGLLKTLLSLQVAVALFAVWKSRTNSSTAARANSGV